jgi:hypothetical protein
MKPSQHIPMIRTQTAIGAIRPRRPRFFCYIRFSSKPQEDGDSERRQLEKGMKRAADLGGEFVDAYTDRGLSGFTGANRDGDLGRMIEDVEAGKIQPGDIIWVENHDRLTRRPPLEAIEQFIRFLNAGIVLDINDHSRTKEILNQQRGFGLLVQDLIEMFRAYQESQRKSEMGTDTNAKKRDNARGGERRVMKTGAGCFVGRRCHAWLRPLAMPSPEGYLYEILPDRDGPWREIARRAFLLADAGNGSWVISKRFNDEKVPPLEVAHRLPDNPNERRKKQPVATKWTPGSVWQLLCCRAIVGEYQPHVVKNRKKTVVGDPIKGYYPPLFPEDPGIFYRVAIAMQGRNKAGGKGRNGHNFGNIIKGLGDCELCGGTVVRHTSSGRKKVEAAGREVVYSLRCTNAKHGAVLPEGHPLAGQKCPNSIGFPYATFEAALFGLFSPTMIPVLAEMIPQKHRDDLVARRLSDTEANIGEHQQAIKRLARLIAGAEDDEIADVYDAEVKRIRVEVNQLRDERDRLRQQATTHAENHEQQIVAVLSKLQDTSDPRALYDARVQLHHLLARYIAVTLHRDRTIRVRVNAHSGLNPVDARLTLDGLEAIDVIDQDGSVLTHFDRAGLVVLEPVNTFHRPDEEAVAAAA